MTVIYAAVDLFNIQVNFFSLCCNVRNVIFFGSVTPTLL